MKRARFAFAHVSEALNFLSCVLEPHNSDRWKEIGALGLTLLTKPRVAIEGPGQWLQTPEVRRLLGLHGAESVPPTEPCDGVWVDILELHRKVVLTQLPAVRACKRFLVVPATDERRSHYDLLDALGGLRGFHARVWSVNVSDQGDRRVFVLESESDGAEPPRWLPGAPAIVGDYSGRWVFTPIGCEHPFGRRWGRLLPPGLADEPLVWLPTLDAAPVVRRLKSRMQPQPILSMLDMTFASAARTVSPVTLSDGDDIPIEVVPGPPRPIDDERPVAACVYRLRTSRSQVGTELLRLMDLDEAGIYDLQYFNRATTPSPFSDVEHFLLQEGTALAQDDAFPHLERFDSPVSLDELGLRAFFSHRCRVRPDVTQLVEQLSSNDDLLKRLRQSLHIDDVPDAIVLVESGDVPRAPTITLLAGGRPLRDVVAPLLRTWDSVPAEQALAAQFPKHDDRRVSLSKAWMACGQADAAEIVRQTVEFASWARLEIAATVARMKAFEDRLQACAEIAADGARLVSAAPTDIQKLVGDTVRLVESLAQPRRTWLASVEQRESALSDAAAAAQQLGVNATARAEAARTESQRLVALLRERQRGLAGALEQMDRALGELKRAHTEVEHVLPTTLQRIAAGRAAHAKHRVEIQKRLDEALSARRELDQEAVEVATFEAQVTDFEGENAELEAQNKARRAEAKSRLDRAERERTRLERVRDVEIPAAIQAAGQLEAEIEVLRAKNLDTELAHLRQRIVERQADRDALRAVEARCVAERKRQSELQAEVDALRAQKLDAQLAEVGREIGVQRGELNELLQKLDELRARRREASAAQASMTEEREVLVGTEAELAAAEKVNDVMKSQIDARREKLDERKKELERERARLEDAETVDLPRTRADVAKAEEDLASIRSRDVEGESLRLREKATALTKERVRLTSLESEAETMRAETDQLGQSVATLRANGNEARHVATAAALHATKQDLEELRSRLAALSPSTSDVERAFDDARRELEKVRRDLGISWWRVVLPPRQGP
jgi:hypothetical protein